jgi:SAM-dependent methyltransferase
MISHPPSSVSQHNDEIHENRLAWDRKPALRTAYGNLYRCIAYMIDRSVPGEILELGSGMGNIKTFVPDCVTTDLFPNEWLDRTENLYALSCMSGSVSNIILFDVWHHIEYPADALAEFRRVLAPGGRVILMEPSMSLLGRFVYGLFHHEPLGFNHQFSSEPSRLKPKEKTNYFAAQSSCHRLIRNRELPLMLQDWEVLRVEEIASFSYLASGGFRGPQLYPDFSIPLLRFIDRAASIFPSLFAARLCAAMKKIR